MNFKTYSRLNTIVGWVVFAIAAFTYLSTIEWTVSLWDCGEFIPSAYKLEVSHPPGAPLHGIINHIFTMFSGGNVKMVPILVNSSAALASAFTILFLFWSITALAMKLLVKNEEDIEQGTIWAILGAGAVGALAYTFSDTFWFSAVEGEVYALSSFFTALIFWVVMKWERRANEPGHLRWFVLMFYLIGLVIGIHLLGLLVIPVIVLVYYYKKYTVTRWGVVLALIIGFAALGVVQIVIIQSLLVIGGQFDLLFVNDFNMPFWSGVIFFYVALLGGCCYLIYYTHKKKKILFNLFLLCFVSVVVGYSSYALAVVRAYANPPINMNNPSDVFTLVGYLAREQYGDSYVTYGPYYNAPYGRGEGGMQYYKDDKKHKYVEMGNKFKPKYDDDYCTFFPRMYDAQDNHKGGYRIWAGLKKVVDPADNKEKYEDEIQGFHFSFVKHNLRFFWNYQMNYMYWRYFAWNFIGRQNDMQGTQGEFHQGNWITGIPFIDAGLGRGPQDHIPTYMRTNKAHNVLFGLPFILGILGMIYQYKRSKLDFAVVFLFFFMTGIAIELYLNMPNPQPRERDYAFVGSFYVYAIWIGLGVLWIWDQLRQKMASVSAASVASILCLVAGPALMAFQEWDDHDRHDRYTSLDFGVDYLQSCKPHSILLCSGDNDTYPLWYAQEVEGIRDDVRIVNTSLLSTDYYIDEMRKKINHAPALPFSLSSDQARGWEYVVFNPDAAIDSFNGKDVTEILQYMGNSNLANTATNKTMGISDMFLPTRKMTIKIDREKVLHNGSVDPKYASLVPDKLEFELKKNTYYKTEIMVLDMIANSKFDVPIYFSTTSCGQEDFMLYGKYFQQEGLVYRLVPYPNPNYKTSSTRDVAIDAETMYTNVMTKFKWGGLEKGNHFIDDVTHRECTNMRNVLSTLANTMLNEGKKAEAIKVADKSLYVLPENNIPYDAGMVQLVSVYYRADAPDKGYKLANRLSDLIIEELTYYSRCKQQDLGAVYNELNYGMYALEQMLTLSQKAGQKDLANKIKPAFDNLSRAFGMQQQQQGGGPEEQ